VGTLSASSALMHFQPSNVSFVEEFSTLHREYQTLLSKKPCVFSPKSCEIETSKTRIHRMIIEMRCGRLLLLRTNIYGSVLLAVDNQRLVYSINLSFVLNVM
jgi:hypothetical protein